MPGVKVKRALVGWLLSAWLVMLLSSAAAQEKNDSLFFSQVDTSFCRYLTTSDRSLWEISADDSIRSYKEMFLPGYQLFLQFRELQDKIKKGKYSAEEKLSTKIDLLEQIQQKFEDALKLNPFGPNYKIAIQTVYHALEDAYAAAKDERKHFVILNRILCYENNRINRMDLYFKLGRIYFNSRLWQPAEKYFQAACDSIFGASAEPIDTMRLFLFLRYRGEAQLKLYKAEQALVSFEYARMIAPNEQWKNQMTYWIDYIGWDDGNLKSVELRQEALAAVGEKNFENAEMIFRDLLEIIKTRKAKNEIQLRLATLQFYNLNKKEEGVDRLWKVVSKLNLDPVTKAPSDSNDIRYWTSYAQMCFRLANENLSTDRKKSFAYFYAVSNIESPLRGKAYLSLANLAGANNALCLEFCNRANNYYAQFSADEKKLLYELLYTTYLKKGDYAQALAWFKKYQAI